MEMKKLKVEIMCVERIKPSRGTPREKRELKLSLLDQLAPSSYTPLLLFYSGGDHRERCRKLKESLAETLSRFYHLAGSQTESYLVDCNDKGVEFCEARVWGIRRMCEVMGEGEDVVVSSLLHRLLPFNPDDDDEIVSRDCILGVRYNMFECGGAVLALCFTHKIVDGTSATMFANAWAAACRGDNENPVVPTFDATALFPPIEIRGGGERRQSRMAKIVTRRFIFNKSKIDDLKKQAHSDEFLNQRPPSRVETVSGFLWKRFMAISKRKSTKAKRFAAIHTVSLRNRMEPPLPPHSFGNIWSFVTAEAPIDEEQPFPVVVAKIRKAINGIDGEYIKNLQDAEKTMRDKMKMGQMVYSGELEAYTFTSWCGFGLYETDFGWGKPMWVCSPGRPYKNVVLFVNTRDGEGIEAWVNLDQNDMAVFQTDSELLSYTSSSSNLFA